MFSFGRFNETFHKPW